jgi:dihydroorotate dehydrogenase (fumarate)
MHAAKLVGGLEQWMLRKGFNSIDDFRGLLAVPNDVDGAAYERQGYVAALTKDRSSFADYAVSKV